MSTATGDTGDDTAAEAVVDRGIDDDVVPSGLEHVRARSAELFGVLSEDVAGAALVAGGWTVGKRASRSPLAKAAATLGERVVEAIYGRDHRSAQLWAVGAVS